MLQDPRLEEGNVLLYLTTSMGANIASQSIMDLGIG